ncbi:MAG TPA: hypothetical protein VGJ20_41960 [Xanthobacteraceae bacterium]|jgi:hypothetical protein
MTDIVERLRRGDFGYEMGEKAANEIERLRAENDKLRTRVEHTSLRMWIVAVMFLGVIYVIGRLRGWR